MHAFGRRLCAAASGSSSIVRRPVPAAPSSLSSASALLCRRTFAASSSPPPPPASTARHNALLTAIKQIEHSFGKGTVMQLGQRTGPTQIDVVPSGSLGLDAALGVGGFPRGRVVEIYGAESSGKTTLALHVVAEAQKRGLTCVFVDAEHALDPSYASALGVDLDSLYVSQPDTGEAALEVIDTLVRSGGMDVVVVDSVAALVPKAELEGEMGDSHMALQARLMSQALRKLTASLSRAKTMIIFLNQIRSKVGVVFGSPDVTTGGNALKFYASIRCEVRRTSVLKDKEDNSVGNMIKVKVSKNKLAPPFRTAEFEMTYGRGISRAGECVDLGTQAGVLKKAGAYYSVADAAVAEAMTRAAAKEAEAAAGKTAAAAAASEGVAVAAPVAAPVPASSLAGKGKGAGKKKGGAAAAAAAAAAEQEEEAAAAAAAGVAGTAAGAAPAAAAATASSSPPPTLSFAVEAGVPFAQGREKAKALLEAHPAALEVLYAAVKRALLDAAAAGATAGTTGGE
jgi:recombination protein RecA